MRVRVERLRFEDRSTAEVDFAHRMVRVVAGAGAPAGWTRLISVRPVGPPKPKDSPYPLSRMRRGTGDEVEVGRAVEILTETGSFTSTVCVARLELEIEPGVPAVEEYAGVLEQFEEAISRSNLAEAARLQLRAFELMVDPDWFTWRGAFMDGHGRGIPFLRAKGARVAALHFSEERADLARRAIETICDERAFSVDEVVGYARSLRWMREGLATDPVQLGDLTREMRARGEKRVKTLVNWLQQNREVHLDGSAIVPGPDSSLPRLGRSVPPFRTYFAAESDMDAEQRSFFADVFVPRFLAGDAVDLEGNISYGFVLLYKLVREREQNLQFTRGCLELAERAYPGTSLAFYANRWLADLEFLDGDFEAGVRVLRRESLPMDVFLALARQLDLLLVARDVRDWLGSDPGLTSTGMTIRDAIDVELQSLLDEFHAEHGVSLVEDLWQRLGSSRVPDGPAPLSEDELLGFMDQETIELRLRWADDNAHLYNNARNAFNGIHDLTEAIDWPGDFPAIYWYRDLLEVRLRALYREAENRVRAARGLPAVGEGWVSEVQLLNLLRAAFPEERVVHQARPKWLQPQSLDIFFPEHNVGVEYQGAQHSEPIARFGGEQGHAAQLERDSRKRRLCAEHGCVLVEVHPGYDSSAVVAQIRSALGRPL